MADERRHGPVELAELPGTRGYTVEGEVEPEPAHAASCRCLDCHPVREARRQEALRRNLEQESEQLERRLTLRRVVHLQVAGPRWQQTAACGAVAYPEVSSLDAPRMTTERAQATCPACLKAKP